jgi:hypothetical protein
LRPGTFDWYATYAQDATGTVALVEGATASARVQSRTGESLLFTTDLPDEGDVLTPTARAHCPSLTASRLGEVWPEVSGRLARMLMSRGVDPALRDDIVQEVALRALAKQVPFTDPADLYRWAAVTARNLHVDHLRTGGRTTDDDALAAMPDHTDVAHAAERRIALRTVIRELAVMRPGDREAILEGLRSDQAPATSQMLVRRHRARTTLRRAVGGAIAAMTTWRVRLRMLVDGEVPAVHAAGMVLLAAPVAAYGLAALAPHATRHDAPHTPVANTREVRRDAVARDVPAPSPAPSPAARMPVASTRPTLAPAPHGTTVPVPGDNGKVVLDPSTTPQPSQSGLACAGGVFDVPTVCTPPT